METTYASGMIVLSSSKVLCPPRRQDDSLAMPFGALINSQPAVALPLADGPPAACSKCGAYISTHAAVTSGTGEWCCTFCSHLNAAPLGPRMEQEEVDYAAPATGATTPPGPLRIIALDLASPQAELQQLAAAARHALDALPDAANVALLSYGRAISVFRLGSSGCDAATQADVLAADGPAAENAVHILDVKVHVASLGQCRQRLYNALGSLRSHGTAASTLAGLGAAIAAALLLSTDLGEAQAGAPGDLGQPLPQDMQRLHVPTSGHIVLLTAAAGAGLADQGTKPSAAGDPVDEEAEEDVLRYLDDLATAAAGQGVVIDAFAAGPPGSAARLAVLAVGTGGTVFPHHGADSALPSNLRSAVGRMPGLPCTLEVRCSSGLRVRDLVGAVVPVALAGRPAPGWSEVAGSKPLPTRMLSPGSWHYDCALPDARQSMMLHLAGVAAEGAQRAVYLQVALTWVQPGGVARQRVATRRLHPTEDAAQVAAATLPDVAALVLAKSAVGQALASRATQDRKEAEILRRNLGKTLQTVAATHGKGDESSKGWFSGPSRFALPPGASVLADVAYSLYRGPLMGKQALVGGSDARELLLLQCLSAQTATADRMVRPQLQVVLPSARPSASALDLAGLAGPAVELQAVPPCDLALLLSLAAVVDTGVTVFVWLSGAAQEQRRVREACQQVARQLSEGHHPAADVVMVRQGEAQEREVLAWLEPLSWARPVQRLQRLPMLASFSKVEVEAASERAAEAGHPGEQVPFLAWLDKLGVTLEELQT